MESLRWEDWSWQLKRYVGLYKPLAKLLMDDVEGSNVANWSKECPKGKGRMSALTEEEQGSGAEWYDEWNHWSPDEWSNDDWSWKEQDWNGEWIGSVDDWSSDWSWSEDDWSSWPEDWSWNTQEWAQPQSSNGAASSGSNVPQDTAKNEPPQNVSAVTVDS